MYERARYYSANLFSRSVNRGNRVHYYKEKTRRLHRLPLFRLLNLRKKEKKIKNNYCRKKSTVVIFYIRCNFYAACCSDDVLKDDSNLSIKSFICDKGIAKLLSSLFSLPQVLSPSRLPSRSHSAPPELPGFISALW